MSLLLLTSCGSVPTTIQPEPRVQADPSDEWAAAERGCSFSWGTRYFPRTKEHLEQRGCSLETEAAVQAGLNWLARHQRPDGSWRSTVLDRCAGPSNQCPDPPDLSPSASDNDVGLTGLALLAFLSTGYTHYSEDQFPSVLDPTVTIRPGTVVKSGLKWLLAHQDANGCFKSTGSKPLYSHILATMAVVEAYGMIGSPVLAKPAQLAIDYLLNAQNPAAGWRYSARSGSSDTSVTTWAILAVCSALKAEMTLDASKAFSGARKWLDQVTDSTVYHRVGYDSKRRFHPDFREREGFDYQETPTAMGVLVRYLLDKKRTASTSVAMERLIARGQPQWNRPSIDYTYWHFGTLAMQHHGDRALWTEWSRSLNGALLPNQSRRPGQCVQGSWDPGIEFWAREGGRVYSTAINVLTLETGYRYVPFTLK